MNGCKQYLKQTINCNACEYMYAVLYVCENYAGFKTVPHPLTNVHVVIAYSERNRQSVQPRLVHDFMHTKYTQLVHTSLHSGTLVSYMCSRIILKNKF